MRELATIHLIQRVLLWIILSRIITVIQECDIQSYNQPGRYQVELLRERLLNATSQPRVERNSIESDDKNKGNQHKG